MGRKENEMGKNMQDIFKREKTFLKKKWGKKIVWYDKASLAFRYI